MCEYFTGNRLLDCVHFFYYQGYQNSETLSLLMVDDLEVPGHPEVTKRLLEKRQEFFATHASHIGLLDDDPASSLPQFIALLFPAFLQKLVSRKHKQRPTALSFVHVMCKYLLSVIKRHATYSKPLFPKKAPDSLKEARSVILETTLRSANSALRSTLRQCGSSTLLSIAAEMNQRIDAIQGSTRSATRTSNLSTQNPFVQSLTRYTKPGTSVKVQRRNQLLSKDQQQQQTSADSGKKKSIINRSFLLTLKTSK